MEVKPWAMVGEQVVSRQVYLASYRYTMSPVFT